MAGKVAKIQEIITPVSLARELSGLYNKWWIQRSEKEKEWRELRNYLFATDTTKTTNSKLPWKNKTTIPKLTQIRDNLHANYMDALFPNDDWLRWEGYGKDDVTKAKRKAIEAFMKTKLRESGFRETISQIVYDYIDFGNCIGDVSWVNESHKDPVTGEDIDGYIGPKANRVSAFDIVFNPVAPSFKDSPKFTRYIKSIGELKKDFNSDPSLGYSQDTFNKIIDTRKALSAFSMEDINKSTGYIIDGFGSLSEYYQSGMVELLEFEGDYYDDVNDVLYENKNIIIADRTFILRNIDNPSWFGTDSKVHVGWRDRPDNLYAMGPLDNLVGLQYRVDHLENLKADALDMTIHPPKVIKGEVDPFTWEPDTVIHISEDGEFSTLPPNEQAFQVNNEIAYLLTLMEEMAGAPKEAMGIRTPGEKTAFEVQQLQNAAGRIFQNKINKFEIQFLEPIINKMLEIAKRKASSKDIIRVMDDDIGVIEFINVKKEDLTARGKLRPIGARHYAARAQLMQNMIGVFNSPIGEMIKPHVSAKNLASLIEEQMGFEQFGFIKDNIAVVEQAETQSLVNQASQTIQQQDAQPTDESLIQNQNPVKSA